MKYMTVSPIGRFNKTVWVVDDFYKDPHAVREFALKQKFSANPEYHKGIRTEEQFFVPGTKETFENIMGDELVNNHDSELTNVKYSDCMSIKQTEAKSFIQDESPLCKIVGPLDKIKWKQVYKGFNEFSPSINDNDEIKLIKMDPGASVPLHSHGG